MNNSYTDQARRVVRSFAKLPKNNYALEFSEEEGDAYYHFFQDAYHLKDWVLGDDNTNISRGKMNEFIEKNENMKLLQSIVNSIKHLRINNSNNKFSNINFIWKDSSEAEVGSCPSILYEEDGYLMIDDNGFLLTEDGDKLIIGTAEKEIHPKKLAVKVLIAWNIFFKENNLTGGFEIVQDWDKHL